MDTESKPVGRYLIALGVSHPGEGTRLRVLKLVGHDLKRVRELLVKDQGYEEVILGYDAATGAPNLNLSAEQIRTGLITWREKHRKGPGIESLVFYFSGHGFVSGGELYLCTRGFLDAGPVSGLSASDLGSCLEYVAVKTWVILDVCYAGAGADALFRKAIHGMNPADHTLWFLASSGGRSESQDGVLSQALQVAAGEAPGDYGALVQAIQKAVGTAQLAQSFTVGHFGFDLLRPISAETARRFRRQRRRWLAQRYWDRVAFAISAAALAWIMVRDGRPVDLQLKDIARGNTAMVHYVLRSISDALRPVDHSAPSQPQAIQTPAPVQSADDQRRGADPRTTAEPPRADAPPITPVPPAPPAALDHAHADRTIHTMRVAVLAEPNGRPAIIDDEHPLLAGDHFGFHVSLPVSGHVGVIHIDRHGESALIYPRVQEQYVRASEATRVPFRGSFQVDATAGVERFILFVSDTPTEFLSLRAVLAQIRRATTWPWSRKAPAVTLGGPWIRTRASFVLPDTGIEATRGVHSATLIEVGHLEANAL